MKYVPSKENQDQCHLLKNPRSANGGILKETISQNHQKKNYLVKNDYSGILTLFVVGISASETAHDYHYNRWPNQRFVYTLGPNIYAGSAVALITFINAAIYLMSDWRNCCRQCARDDELEEEMNDHVTNVYEEQIQRHKPNQELTNTYLQSAATTNSNAFI